MGSARCAVTITSEWWRRPLILPRPLGRFAAGAWVGVELKSENGKNDGSVQVSRSRSRCRRVP